MRERLNYAVASLSRGINQDSDAADFSTQVIDARNVWCPRGEVKRRPGSEFLAHTGVLNSYGAVVSVATASRTYKETAAGTTTDEVAGVLDVSSLGVGGFIYIGFPASAATANAAVCGIQLAPTAENSAATEFMLHYWNGAWVNLPALNAGSGQADTLLINNSFLSTLGLSGGGEISIMFAIPPDWAASTRAYGGSLYWLRATIKGVALDGTTELTTGNIYTYTPTALTNTNTSRVLSVLTGSVAQTPIYGCLWNEKPTIATVTTSGLIAVGFRGGLGSQFIGHLANDTAVLTQNASPQLSTSTYVDLDQKLYYTTPAGVFTLTRDSFITSAADMGTIHYSNPATVEDSNAIVGAQAAYDRNYIAQHAAFPKAKYISYFQNRFWFAGIEGQPQTIQWGAAAPSYKVLPSLSYEDVQEGSQYPISGMAPLGENMLVYKPDSIHQMVFTELDEFDLARFVPRTIARGVGTVSHASIASVNGTHVFLSDRGLMQFDGVRARQISLWNSNGPQGTVDRLAEFWPTLDPGRSPFAVGVHWAAQKVYLLACSVSGAATNSHVVVWDYVRDALWIWNGLDVLGWFFEDNDQKQLGYADSNGRLFRLAGGSDFFTAISSYVTTHRLGQAGLRSTALRLVELDGVGDNGATTVELLTNDNSIKTGTLTWPDVVEDVYGTGKYGTAKYVDVKPRTRRLSFRETGRYHQIKVASATKDTEFRLTQIKLGYNVQGKR